MRQRTEVFILWLYLSNFYCSSPSLIRNRTRFSHVRGLRDIIIAITLAEKYIRLVVLNQFKRFFVVKIIMEYQRRWVIVAVKE